jgi:hypothetical protein
VMIEEWLPVMPMQPRQGTHGRNLLHPLQMTMPSAGSTLLQGSPAVAACCQAQPNRQRTWWHKWHAACCDDDVLCCDLAAHVHAAWQAVLDGVVVNKLGLANQDVLQAPTQQCSRSCQ